MKGGAGPPAALWLASPIEGILTSQHGCDERRNQAPCIDGEVED